MGMGNVGTTKIFENDKMIVWEFVLDPGDTTPLHTHQHDYMFYVLDGAPLDVFDAAGESLGQLDARSGARFRPDRRWRRPRHCWTASIVCRSRIRRVMPARTRYREILVETK